MIAWQKFSGLPTLAIFTSSCGIVPIRVSDDHNLQNPAASCEYPASLSEQESAISGELDAGKLTVLNWHLRKASHPALQSDLAGMRGTADLVLLQEAVLNEELLTLLGPESHRAFAPGYTAFGEQSGVVTAANVAPTFKCTLSHPEPWLRSPKATSIARYAIKDSALSLLVINTHVVNFTMGTAAISRQLNAAMDMIDMHNGPIIVSGDFNTWSKMRGRWVDEQLRAKGLEPVSFRQDHRKRFLGNALDHIYVRSLRPLNSATFSSDSSDHNPMLVSLEFEQ